MTKYKNIFIFNIISMFIMIILDVIYLKFGIPYVFKTLSSVFFVLIGVINLIFAYKHGFKENKLKKFSILMLIGLVFAMAGDILLIEPDLFAVGAGVFAIGHIFFFIAYLHLSKFSLMDLICFVCIFVPSLLLILIYDGFVFEGIMLAVVVIYALIISLMLGKSVSNLFNKDIGRIAKILVFVGSLMFFLSDMCLLFHVFAGWGRWIDVLCLAFYYPAEIILATSIFYSSRKEVE